MKRPLDIASILVFLLPLPFLVREPWSVFAAWTLAEFLVSLALSRLESRGRLDGRSRAQMELVLRTLCLPLTVLMMESAGPLVLAALLRYALTCGLMGFLRLRWLFLFLILFPAGSAALSFFQSFPEIPYHAAGPVFAAASLGAVCGMAARVLRQQNTLLARATSGMKRAFARLRFFEGRVHQMLSSQMKDADARLFARGGLVPSLASGGVVFSLYLRESPDLERLPDADFDREWEQFLGRIGQAATRYAMIMRPAGSVIRFLRSGTLPADQQAAFDGASEILGFAAKTRMHHASMQKAWPAAFGMLSAGTVREVSAGPDVPQRMLLGDVLVRHDSLAADLWRFPEKERWLSTWPLIDQNLSELTALVEPALARAVEGFVLPGSRPSGSGRFPAVS